MTAGGFAVGFVTLNDGIARQFKWDFNAVVRMEQVAPHRPGESRGPFEQMRAVLYAALYKDAMTRPDDRLTWTIEKVGELIPSEPGRFMELMSHITKLKKEAERGPGESTASPARGENEKAAKRSRGTTAKR